MTPKHYPPTYEEQKFHCPYCQVYAAQSWAVVYRRVPPGMGFEDEENLSICECSHCERSSYWFEGRMIFPADAPVPPPHEDLPDECRSDYEEARDIFSRSPRASTALLRLCVQKLLVHLGGDGKHINSDIKRLVENGLSILVQQALDYCRVIGNNSVHPGEINVNDTPEIAASLFGMINFIVEDRITRPKQIESLYNQLPEGAREAIHIRDEPK